MSGEVEIARIEIVRYATEDDVIDRVTTSDGMSLTEALGMMRLAEDTLIEIPPGTEED